MGKRAIRQFHEPLLVGRHLALHNELEVGTALIFSQKPHGVAPTQQYFTRGMKTNKKMSITFPQLYNG